jgi:hypothetical protein
LLQEQRDRVAQAADAPEDKQLALFDEQEARQRVVPLRLLT